MTDKTDLPNPLGDMGGQHSASVGDSTTHHRHPWDFSVALGNAHERLAEWQAEQERVQFGTINGREW